MSLAAAALEGAPDAGRRGEDRALAIALRSGAPGAATRAWETFAPIVLRILRRTLGADPDRQDLLQEVFIRVFRRINDLRDQDALRAFVVHICMGVAQNELRRRRGRRRLGLSYAAELPEPLVAEADFEARQAIARYRRILDCLGADDRAAFVLRYVEKMDVAEVAAALGWSPSKTKRRLARVTARVTRLMEREPALAHYATRLGTARGASAKPNPKTRGDQR